MEINNIENVQKLFDNDGLLDILISFEDYIDSQDLYVFDNWIDGEIAEGPIVSKYWVEVTLKYDASNAPDPRGALLFNNQGTTIQVRRDIENVPIRIPLSPDDIEPVEMVQKPKMEQIPVILIKFTVPRKLLDPDSSQEYNVIDAENMSNILIDKAEDEAEIPAPEEQEIDQEGF